MLTTTPANAEERYKDVPGMSYLALDQYQREVAWIELLSYEEQERLLERVARSQRVPENAHYALLARDARARLVEQYQPLVFQMAKRWVRFSEKKRWRRCGRLVLKVGKRWRYDGQRPSWVGGYPSGEKDAQCA